MLCIYYINTYSKNFGGSYIQKSTNLPKLSTSNLFIISIALSMASHISACPLMLVRLLGLPLIIKVAAYGLLSVAMYIYITCSTLRHGFWC